MSLVSPPADKLIGAKIPSLTVIAGVSAVFLVAMILVQISGTNVALFHWLNGLSRITGEPVWANITLLGEGLLALALLAPIARWRPDIAWSLFLSALVATVVIIGVKELFAMPRPALLLAATEFTVIGPRLSVVSFPSGHTATIAVFATVVALHVNQRSLYLMLAAIVALVGLSRVVVGAHWPMDVFGGMLLGWWLALVGIRLANHLRYGVERNWQIVICLVSVTAAALFWGAETGQHQAVLLQRGTAIIAGLLGLWTLATLWQRTKY